MPNGARWINTVSVSRNIFPPPGWAHHVEKLLDLPIFLINCHSAICASYTTCDVPGRTGDELPTFHIPNGTFVLNVSDGGEVCAPIVFDSRKLYSDFYKMQLIRRTLLIDDKEDIPKLKRMRFNYSRSISGFMRATDTKYPNFVCSFVDDTDPNLGVFDLEDTDTNLIDISAGDMFLEDIIRTVYTKCNIDAGIFVFVGCSSPFVKHSLADVRALSDAFDKAYGLIRTADLTFAHQVPTASFKHLQREGLAPVDIDAKIPFPAFVYPNSKFIASMADTLDESPGTLFPIAKKHTKKFKNNPTEMNGLREEVILANEIMKK